MNIQYINNDKDFRNIKSINESRNKWEKLFEDFGDDENLNEADDSKENKKNTPKELSDDEIKEKSMDFAIDIARLMSNVMVDDIVGIAGKVADFIKNHQINGAGADAFSLEDESNSEESSTEENNSEESTEDNAEFQEA
jgi:hypothetical protein